MIRAVNLYFTDIKSKIIEGKVLITVFFFYKKFKFFNLFYIQQLMVLEKVIDCDHFLSE
jgi:hypothetical protein